MEIITLEEEYELVSNEQCTLVTLTARPVNEYHAGHIHYLQQAKILRPDDIIVLRFYSNLIEVSNNANWYIAKFDPDTGAPVQSHGAVSMPTGLTIDTNASIAWIDALNAVDKVVVVNITETDPKKVQMIIGGPVNNLDNIDDTGIEEFMVEWDLYQGPNIFNNNVLAKNVLHIYNEDVDYACRISSDKDLYYAKAKDFIYKHFNRLEHIIIEAENSPEYGIPLGGRIEQANLSAQQKAQLKSKMNDFDQNRVAPTVSISPKFLGGATYEELQYTVPGWKTVTRGRIV